MREGRTSACQFSATTKRATAPTNTAKPRVTVSAETRRANGIPAIETGEKNVTELVRLTESTQANVSKHLGILSDAGMISRRKEGLKTFYEISDAQIFKLCDLMCSKLQKEFSEKSAHFRSSGNA